MKYLQWFLYFYQLFFIFMGKVVRYSVIGVIVVFIVVVVEYRGRV